ncbi:MAG: hypothetical protein AAF865_01950 [Pseudomonadota bacterium]
MADDLEAHSTQTEDAHERFNRFISQESTTLQLHAQRYEAFERSFEILAKSSVTLNGGAVLVTLTTETLQPGASDSVFALWFVAGCIAFLIGAFSRYNSKRQLLNNPLAYFPTLAHSDEQLQHINTKTKALSDLTIYSFLISLLAFSVGCAHGFLVLSNGLAQP